MLEIRGILWWSQKVSPRSRPLDKDLEVKSSFWRWKERQYEGGELRQGNQVAPLGKPGTRLTYECSWLSHPRAGVMGNLYCIWNPKSHWLRAERGERINSQVRSSLGVNGGLIPRPHAYPNPQMLKSVV